MADLTGPPWRTVPSRAARAAEPAAHQARRQSATHHRLTSAALGGLSCRQAWGVAWPGDEPWHGMGGSPAGTLTPGSALIALLEELADYGLPVTGMTITRLQGTLTLPVGPVVACRDGWLCWSAGRSSRRGRPLQRLHSARDAAGAARRLARSVPPVGRNDTAAGGGGD